MDNGKTETNQPLELEERPNDPDTPSEAVAQAPASEVQDPLRKLQAERDALFDRLARQQAEFENYRKRVEKDKQESRDFTVVETLKPLLPILDNFELALKAQSSGSDLRKGVDLIRKQMEDALSKLGVQAISAPGQPFDPRLHEAIEMVESSEVEDNHVLEELQRGYKYKDKLLRPAMVRVATNHKK
ncbi:MAG TPA: nucleotide exchange factor GrpE [Terriglobales bacterium]|nr:nucleotide exchange factor GrpE [Terriglobales bacterium]